MKTIELGRLVITLGNQASNAPFIDVCSIVARDPKGGLVWSAKGKAIQLLPWKRNQYGESLPQKVLIIGWKYLN